MIRLLALVIMLTGISATGHTRAEVPVAHSGAQYAGKSGRGLAEALRRACRPPRLAGADAVSYTLRDPFQDRDVTVARGALPEGYVRSCLVPAEWWSDVDIYGDTVRLDLNNYLPLEVADSRARADLPPAASLDETTGAFTHWSVGRGILFGSLTDMYMPPAAMRGRLARAYFYMAVMYPHYTFTPRGFMVMSTDYPWITETFADLFVRWAREYAPDEVEKAWEGYAASLQGGGNPFVTEPQLIEYIWGDKAGEIYAVEGEPVPLHSTYRMDSDRVWLTSPHVPADAVWSIDGMRATTDSYNPADLGAGEYHLTYTSPSTGRSGRVMIKIVSQ